jgi:hypothetical protein
MTPETPITQLEMSDGNIVPVPRGGLLAFVGPNNSGKSVSLRDIYGHLTQSNVPARAVKSITVDKDGSEEDLLRWLDKHCHKRLASGQELYSRAGVQVYRNHAVSWWVNGPPYQQLGQVFAFLAGGEGRLAAANATNNINPLTEPPSHPLHSLYMDSELEEKISAISVKAFGVPLVLNRHAGNRIYLHVGQAPPAPHGVGAPPREYLEALSEMPQLDEQGDGMKSLMGLMLNIAASSYPLVLVDEPEAFLHPPQARLIGRMLGDEKDPNTQVFLATHDSDVLRGLLDSSTRDLTVVRLTREGTVNHTSQLDPGDVRKLWRDPLLRYSNVLDGLFHDAVVLCEGDADCRFYQSVLDALEAGEDEAKRLDLLWTHCGGKDRMPTVIGALRVMDVPIRVIADFDILRSEQPLRRIVENLGGDWSKVETNWSVVKAALDSESKSPPIGWVQGELDKTLKDVETSALQKEDADKIRRIVKLESGWDKVKRGGRAEVPQGDASARIEKLLASLRDLGLFIVEVGELERFAPTVPGHGPAWVSAVHEQGLHANGSLTEARTFVQAVVASL